MVKVKFDVSASDPEKATQNYVQPPVGTYRAKVDSIKMTKPDGKDRRLEVVYKIINDKKYNGANLFDYINQESEASAWKNDQFLQAFSIASAKRRKGTFDTDDLVGRELMVRVKGDTYNGEYRAKVGSVWAADDDDEDEIDEVDEDEVDEEDDTELDGEDDEEEDDEETAEEDEVDYTTWEIADLRALAKERELTSTGKKSALIVALEEYDSENPFED